MDEESRSHRPQLREKVQTPTDYILSRSILNLPGNTQFSHQQDGPFGRYNRVGAHVAATMFKAA